MTPRRPAVPPPKRVAPVQRPVKSTVGQQARHVEGKATVNTLMMQNKQERGHTHHEESQGLVRFGPGEEPARVRVSFGMTISTAPYEGVRIDVSVELPCLPEDVEATQQQAGDIAAEYLANEESRWRK